MYVRDAHKAYLLKDPLGVFLSPQDNLLYSFRVSFI